MRRRRSKRGQTLVEFAMILPLLLAIIMGIIDFSYIIFSWAEVQFAARRGAEQASKLPPQPIEAPKSDGCRWPLVWREIQKNGAFSRAAEIKQDEVTVSYWEDGGANSIDPDARFVKLAQTGDLRARNVRDTAVEIRIVHPVRPLTPLGETLFGDNITMSAASRRSLLNIDSPFVCP